MYFLAQSVAQRHQASRSSMRNKVTAGDYRHNHSNLRVTSQFSEYTISAATKWGFLGTWTSDPLPAVSTENAPERRIVVTGSLQGGECQSPDQAAARHAMSRQGRLGWGRSCADRQTIPRRSSKIDGYAPEIESAEVRSPSIVDFLWLSPTLNPE
jgi:hypothetical protein